MQPVDHLCPRIARSADCAAGQRADHHQAEETAGEQPGAHCIGQPARNRVEITAKRRANHRSALPRDRTQRDRGRERGGGHQIGRDRLDRRPGKGARDAEQGGDHEQRGQGGGAIPGHQPKCRRAARFQQRRAARYPAAIEPVGGPADDQRQRREGEELREADPAELHRGGVHAHGAPRDVINLPADHDHHRQLRQRRHQPRRPEESVVAIGEGVARLIHAGSLGPATAGAQPQPNFAAG